MYETLCICISTYMSANLCLPAGIMEELQGKMLKNYYPIKLRAVF